MLNFFERTAMSREESPSYPSSQSPNSMETLWDFPGAKIHSKNLRSDPIMVAALGRRDWAELHRRRAAALDGHCADAHGDVVGKLAAVLDVVVGAGVENVADRQLPASIVACTHGTFWELDSEAETHLPVDVASHPGEGAVRDGLQILAGAIDVKLEVGRVEAEHVDRHGVGDGDEVAVLGEGVDPNANLQPVNTE